VGPGKCLGSERSFDDRTEAVEMGQWVKTNYLIGAILRQLVGSPIGYYATEASTIGGMGLIIYCARSCRHGHQKDVG